MTKTELTEILKNTVTYNSRLRQHYLGKWDLSNKELRSICSNKLGIKFDKLNKRDKRVFIDELFITLRGDQNG